MSLPSQHQVLLWLGIAAAAGQEIANGLGATSQAGLWIAGALAVIAKIEHAIVAFGGWTTAQNLTLSPQSQLVGGYQPIVPLTSTQGLPRTPQSIPMPPAAPRAPTGISIIAQASAALRGT